MNAFNLLRDDHASISALFDRYRTAASLWSKQELAIRIVGELSAHLTLERESVVIPALKASPSLETQVQKFLEAQALLKTMAHGVAQPAPDAQQREAHLDTKIRALEECYRSALSFEEDELFPRLSAVLDAGQIECLEAALANARSFIQPVSIPVH